MTTRSPRKTGKVREEREADRRRTILRAAIEVFSRKGYHGCRIADVAREAGVAYGLVYHYFHNKDELLESVFESSWSGFVTRVQDAVSKAGSLEERVRAVVNVAFEAYRRDPRAVKVLILEVGRSPAGGAINRGTAFTGIIALVAALFREAQDSGEIPATTDPVICAAMLFGAIETGLTSFVIGLLDRKNDALLDQAKAQVADALLFGLLGRPVPAGEGDVWMTSKPAPKSKTVSRG